MSMKRILIFIFAAFSFAATGQNNLVKNAMVAYSNGAPTWTPGSFKANEISIDTLTGAWYEWKWTTNYTAGSWIASGYRVQVVAGCSAPLYTPGKLQSRLVINGCPTPELYYYTGAAWVQVGGASYTGSYGIDIASTVISADTSEVATPGYVRRVVRDSAYAISAGTGISISGSQTKVITNSAPDQTVSITGGGINTVSGTYPNFTVTGTEVDGSTTNEIEIPSQTGNNGKYLQTDGSAVSWQTVSASPGGSSGQVQYNSSGSFAGVDSIVITTGGPDRLGIGTPSPNARAHIVGNSAVLSGKALFVQNSSGDTLLHVSNNGLLSVGKNKSFTTEPSAQILAAGSDASVTLVLSPKLYGAISRQIADGTATGGNDRGTWATDFQAYRTNAANVASGQSSFAAGQNNKSSNLASFAAGQNNSATGQYSFVSGNNNTASGDGTFVTGATNKASASYSTAYGFLSDAYLYCQVAQSGGQMAGGQYDTQTSSLFNFKAATAYTTGATGVLSLDGTGSTNLMIPSGSNRVWAANITWVAVVSSISGTATGVTVGDVITKTETVLIKRVGGTASIVGSATTLSTQNDASMSTASMAYTAGASNDLRMTFTAPTFAGGGSVTCRVAASVKLVEIAW